MRLIKNDTMWNDPFADLDYFLNRAFGSRAGSLFNDWSDMAPRGFRIDSFQDDDNFYVVAALPGVDKKDISIELENAVLSITAERKTSKEEGAEPYRLSRSVTVGDDVDAEKVTASLENGLLTVTLPKAEQRKPKAITVG